MMITDGMTYAHYLQEKELLDKRYGQTKNRSKKFRTSRG